MPVIRPLSGWTGRSSSSAVQRMMWQWQQPWRWQGSASKHPAWFPKPSPRWLLPMPAYRSTHWGRHRETPCNRCDWQYLHAASLCKSGSGCCFASSKIILLFLNCFLKTERSTQEYRMLRLKSERAEKKMPNGILSQLFSVSVQFWAWLFYYSSIFHSIAKPCHFCATLIFILLWRLYKKQMFYCITALE